MVTMLDAAGFDYVLVETVGTGQSDVEIANITQTRLLLCPAGAGDGVQALKAGVLEIADALVVNKTDLADAEGTAVELCSMLAARPRISRPPIFRTCATSGRGVCELVLWLESRARA